MVISLKYIIAVIGPGKLDVVKKKLQEVEVDGLTVSSVSGYGSQRGYLEFDRNKAQNYEAHLLEMIKLEIAVNDFRLQMTNDAIKSGAKDEEGYVGSGKIFILPLENAIRIRTNENRYDAI